MDLRLRSLLGRSAAVVVAAVATTAAMCGVASAASPPTTVTGPPSAVTLSSATVSGDVDPSGLATDWYFQYGTSSSYGSHTAVHGAGAGSATVGVSSALTGLTPGTTYHFRLVATSEAGTSVGTDGSFQTPAVPPTIATNQASDIADTGVEVSGTIDPNDLATSWYVRYGTSTSYGSTSAAKSAGSGGAPVTVATVVRGLAPDTTYHFQLVATNAAGTRLGIDRSFSTFGPPVPLTGSVSALATTSATLMGSVDPEGHTTVWSFQYGTTTAYGSATPGRDAGAGVAAVAVVRAISGLVPNTTYHFRLVGTNAAGASFGADVSFTTPGPSLAASSSAVMFGQAVTLSGSVPSGKPNESVVLYSEAISQSSFVELATVLTGVGGTWSYTTSPGIETSYKALWSGEVSPVAAVGVAPSVFLRGVSGGGLRTHVVADESFAGRLIRLQRLVHGTWRTIAARHLGRGSVTTFHPDLPAGTFRVRTYLTSFQAAPNYVGAVSGTHLFRSVG